ncbi:MAG: phBC6A51 family helix-turn-helix protein, partial [Candidatus Binataceae bacterium]
MGGRPRWQPDDLAKVERLASQGLTFEQIAASLGIHVATLYKYKRRLGEFNEALEKGRAAGHDTVTSKLFELVRAGNVAAIIFYLKARCGWRDQGPIVEVNNQQQNNVTIMDRALLEHKR